MILGSYNWTASGAYDNDENTLITHRLGHIKDITYGIPQNNNQLTLSFGLETSSMDTNAEKNIKDRAINVQFVIETRQVPF
jgi:phosphatidylserine/phosphatidylglycerophosphate/cardiolipin synthase-like enzyme